LLNVSLCTHIVKHFLKSIRSHLAWGCQLLLSLSTFACVDFRFWAKTCYTLLPFSIWPLVIFIFLVFVQDFPVCQGISTSSLAGCSFRRLTLLSWGVSFHFTSDKLCVLTVGNECHLCDMLAKY